MIIKKCTKCLGIKRLSEFHKDYTKPDGHRPVCKQCRRFKSAIENQDLKKQGLKKCTVCLCSIPIIELRKGRCRPCRISPKRLSAEGLIGNGLKLCPKCNQIKPLSEFSKRPNKTNLYQSWCKSCKNILKHRTYQLNSSLYQEKRRQYYRENKELVLQRKHEHDKNHRKELALKARNYYRDHIDDCRKKSRAKQRPYTAKRRAKLRECEGTFTRSDIVSILNKQNGKCVYCSTQLDNHYHIDHIIPISRGGSNLPDNIQLLCRKCNLSKHNKTHSEFMDWLAK